MGSKPVEFVKTEILMDRPTSRVASPAAVLASAWPALVLATACLLPFLNKPFNIDDSWFLTMSHQIVKHPAHPMDFMICWNADPGCMNVSAWASNALLGEVAQGYLLVPTVLTGTHEWTAHLAQLVLVWIAVLAMASLVLRFGWDRKHAMVGALLLVAIAPFLPMASTAMPEPLATALAVVAMERLAAWKTEQKWSQGAVAAIALGLAGFARPHLVLLLPLAALYLFDNARPREFLGQFRRKFWLWIPVLAGACLMLAVIAATREHIVALRPPSSAAEEHHLARNLFAYLLFLAFPLPLAACWLLNRLRSKRWSTIVLTTAMALAPWICRLPLAIAAFFAVFGCGALLGLLLETLEKRDQTSLILTLWLLIPLPIVYYTHLPAKFLLPCMPAVILLCFQLMEGFPVRFTRAATIALIAASAGYSLLILRSDAEFARFGRNALYALIAPHVAAGEKVWYTGQYWSNWYAPLAGAKLTYPGGPQPKRGDMLVIYVLAGGHRSLARFPHRTLVDVITHKYRFGRTMGGGMGLYSNGLGYWLWGFGESSEDRFELWRIN